MDQPTLFPHPRPWEVTTQQTLVGGQWNWFISAPNNLTVAKSVRTYTTEQGAVESALKVLRALKTNGIKVVRR